MCSSAAPSWYLPVSSSCSTKPTCWSVRSRPWTVPCGSPSSPPKSKAQNSGWIVITWGWGMAVMVAVFSINQFTGAHLNPAVTVGLWVAGVIDGGDVPKYLIGEFVGAFVGASLVLASYWDHFKET